MTETKLEFIFEDAYGYQLKATVTEWNETSGIWEASDISSFTTKQFRIKKPDGSFQTVGADFETDGTDGILVKTVTSAMKLLNQVGWYNMQIILSNELQYFPWEK